MQAPFPSGVSLRPPLVISSPLRPIRLRGALAWTHQPIASVSTSLSRGNDVARVPNPTLEKATMSCKCQLTQTDIKVAVADVSTERYAEDVSVQSDPSTTVYADAYTMPCVADQASQVAKLVILSEIGINTDIFTASVGIQAADCSESSEMGAQAQLVDVSRLSGCFVCLILW